MFIIKFLHNLSYINHFEEITFLVDIQNSFISKTCFTFQNIYPQILRQRNIEKKIVRKHLDINQTTITGRHDMTMCKNYFTRALTFYYCIKCLHHQSTHIQLLQLQLSMRKEKVEIIAYRNNITLYRYLVSDIYVHIICCYARQCFDSEGQFR